MVANIRSGSSPGGALYYNKEKVDRDEAEILYWQKMLEPFDKHGRMDVDACMESFLPYLEANRRMTNTVFHVLPNPSPEDKLTDGQLREIACEYMERMSALTDDGYGVGTPFKSSRIGKDVGYKALQKYYGMSKDNLKKPGALDRLRQTVKDAMSPHNTRDEFRQLLKAESINTVFRINPVGRVYGVTFIDHTNGIVANGSVLGREFSAGVFNELFPTSRKETLHTAEQHAERQYEQRSRTANPVSGVVDTLLDLVDARAFEEQQRIQRRRRKRKLHR